MQLRSGKKNIKKSSDNPVMKKMFVEFGGTPEILDVYHASGEIVDKILGNDSMCPFMTDDYVKFKRIGEGANGIVYSVAFPGVQKQNFRLAVKTEKWKPLDGDESEDSDESYSEEIGCKIALERQNDRTIVDGEEFAVSFEENAYKALNHHVYPILTSKSYLCHNNTYSEYVIGVLMGQLYRNGMGAPKGNRKDFCINFVNVFEFITCYKPREQQYIFMQEVDTTLAHVDMSAMDADARLFLIMQVLMGIYTYQSFGISHNDLRPDNIFLEKITQHTKYRGENLQKYDFLEYKFGDGEKFYLPIPSTNGYIAKIGDWGISIKYGMDNEPTIGNYDVFRGSYDGKKDMSIPNWFVPIYDLYLFLQTSGILPIGPDNTLETMWLRQLTKEAYQPSRGRLPINTLNSLKDMSVKNLLVLSSFPQYKQRPPNRKILTVCDINRTWPYQPGIYIQPVYVYENPED